MEVAPHLHVSAVLVRAHQIFTMALSSSPMIWPTIVQDTALMLAT